MEGMYWCCDLPEHPEGGMGTTAISWRSETKKTI